MKVALSFGILGGSIFLKYVSSAAKTWFARANRCIWCAQWYSICAIIILSDAWHANAHTIFFHFSLVFFVVASILSSIVIVWSVHFSVHFAEWCVLFAVYFFFCFISLSISLSSRFRLAILRIALFTHLRHLSPLCWQVVQLIYISRLSSFHEWNL